MNTISGLAQGAGFALVSESIDEGWTPTHSQHINIVRPLRDVGIKESAFWAWWLKLPVAGRDRYPSTVSSTPGVSSVWKSVKPDLKSSSIDALTYNFIMGLEKDYPSTVSTIARTIAKVTTKETGVKGGCILCQKWVNSSDLRCHLVTYALVRPAQRNVQAWKASISIRSYHDESFVNAKHPLPPHYTAPPALEETTDAEPSFPTSVDLAPRLCYACHTTFTSRSSRGSSSANSIEIPLPVWVKANVTLLDPAGGSDSAILTNNMDRTQGDVAGEDAEVWKVKKLSPGHIKDKIGAFLLDDAE
jgi:cytoplasmic tRNA 2-thiolation protein 2